MVNKQECLETPPVENLNENNCKNHLVDDKECLSPSTVNPPDLKNEQSLSDNDKKFSNRITFFETDNLIKQKYSLAEIVLLGPDQTINGQKRCLICGERFTRDFEIRCLPCLHAFHGKCVLNEVIYSEKNICPVCMSSFDN